MGQPKGVMISHDSITWNANTVGLRLPNIKYANEILISFLPLSHIAAQVSYVNFNMKIGIIFNFDI